MYYGFISPVFELGWRYVLDSEHPTTVGAPLRSNPSVRSENSVSRHPMPHRLGYTDARIQVCVSAFFLRSQR